MVMGALTFDPGIDENEMVELTVPLPIPVRLADPVNTRSVPDNTPVSVSVSVVLTLAAWANAESSNAVKTRRIIDPLLVERPESDRAQESAALDGAEVVTIPVD
jgi:hypothetical protein